MTDDQGNGAYTVKEGPFIGSRIRTFIAYKHNAIGTGGLHFFTVNPAGSLAIIVYAVIEVSGLGTADPFDQIASATGTSTTPDTGNTPTTTVADEILVASMTCGADQTGAGSIVVGGSGWTQRFEERDDSTWNASEGDSKIVTATGAYNATWTQTNSGTWGCIICTFGNSPGGGGGVTEPRLERSFRGLNRGIGRGAG